jgi:hypothetical protein
MIPFLGRLLACRTRMQSNRPFPSPEKATYRPNHKAQATETWRQRASQEGRLGGPQSDMSRSTLSDKSEVSSASTSRSDVRGLVRDLRLRWPGYMSLSLNRFSVHGFKAIRTALACPIGQRMRSLFRTCETKHLTMTGSEALVVTFPLPWALPLALVLPLLWISTLASV